MACPESNRRTCPELRRRSEGGYSKMKKPIVAIIGRPNVGKSTLFNRILGRRAAIVEDIPGVTRDRNYSDSNYSGRPFTLVDTGGLDPTAAAGESILSQVKSQTEHAIREAGIFIMLFGWPQR